MQVDMAAPERFGLRYVGRDGGEHRPAMLHRAVLGSLERFLALYIEHTAGDFPLWLAPVQVAVLPITDRHTEYATKVRDALAARGVRTQLDARAEKLNLKIREAELQKVPIMAVVGDQEEASGSVTPRRRRDARRAAQALPVDAFVAGVVEEIGRRRGAD
jgi:threonyl-tRNA synthetase